MLMDGQSMSDAANESCMTHAGGSGHSQTMELMERKRQLELKKAEMKQVRFETHNTLCRGGRSASC